MATVKRSKWPPIKFLKRDRQSFADGEMDLGFGWELDYSEFLEKWDGGTPVLDSFRFEYEDRTTVARVRRFYGKSEICHSVLSTWDGLPRGSLPIGDIDVAGFDFDSPTLLTFRWGPNFNKVFFFDNPHDVGPLEPDDPLRLIRLSNSLPSFIRSLKCYDELYFRVVYALATVPEELPSIEAALEEAGAEEFEDSYYEARKACTVRTSLWEEQNASLTVAYNVKKINDVQLPALGKNHASCFLAIDASRWDQPAAQRAVRNALKSVAAFKGAKAIGQTSVGCEPYGKE